MARIDFDYIWTDKKRTFLGLPLSFTRYILTEKKLITQTGFLSIHEDEIELYRVSDKSLSLSFGERLFGCGTVTVNCRDVDNPVKVVKSIKAPRKFMELLEENVDIQRDRYRVRGRDMIGADIADHDCHCDHNDDDEFDGDGNGT